MCGLVPRFFSSAKRARIGGSHFAIPRERWALHSSCPLGCSQRLALLQFSLESLKKGLMRRRDIRSWVNCSASENANLDLESPYASDDELRPGAMTEANGMPKNDGSTSSVKFDLARLGDPQRDWDSFIGVLDSQLRSPKTRHRVAFMQETLPLALEKSELGAMQLAEVAETILGNFSRYQDKESRTSAQRLVVNLLSAGNETSINTSEVIARHTVQWLEQESATTCQYTKLGLPRTSASRRANFVLWASSILSAHIMLADKGEVTYDSLTQWKPLVRAVASAYNAIAYDIDTHPRMVKFATTNLRRAVRRAYKAIPALISTLVETHSTTSIPLLGLVIDVSLRLRVGSEPVKGASEGQGRAYVDHAKQAILQAYISQVVSCKYAVPVHVRSAMHDFVATEVNEVDVTTNLRPVMEKMMLRSPEVVMPVVEAFFEAYQGDIGPHLVALQTSLLSAAKSSSAHTRHLSVALFAVLVSKCKDKRTLQQVSTEIVNNLKAGKAGSPEQREASFEMLAKVPAMQGVSQALVNDIVAMLAKEAHEGAVKNAMDAVKLHGKFCLEHNLALEQTTTKGLVKGLDHAKNPLRRSISLGIADLFWNIDMEQLSPAAAEFVSGLLPGWEVSLKNASTNTLTSASGPLEGYTAVAIILNCASYWKHTDAEIFASKNTNLTSVRSVQPKPSFLTNEKVMKKLVTSEEQIWLLRAIESVMLTSIDATSRNDDIARVTGSAIKHVAFTDSSLDARRQAWTTLRHITAVSPGAACEVASHALTLWLADREVERASPQDEGLAGLRDRSRQMKDLLLSVASIAHSTREEKERHDVLENLFCFAHHPELGASQRQCFLELCSAARVDPGVFVEARLHSLYAIVRDALNVPVLRHAALASLSTIVLICPEEASGLVMADVEANVQTSALESLSSDDLGMWKIGPDALYVDVLSKEKDRREDKNRKNDAIEQWEADLRESIAKKRAADTTTLTKEQQKAVEAQKDVERKVRDRVLDLQSKLRNALAMIVSLVESRSRVGIESHMSEAVRLLLRLLSLPQAQSLVGEDLMATFNSLSSSCTNKLGDYTISIRVALLRSISDAFVDNNFSAETLKDLTLRILYRLRFLCEQAPLDLASIAFVEPLLSRVVASDGLGVVDNDGDASEEQMRLTLDIIAFHGNACRDPRFPRLAFVDSLAAIVAKHAQLAKDAVGALRTLGDSMKANASKAEISRLLEHAMAEEVYVRTGALQALQPLDLTEYEFCAELWVACHDEDEENSRLAIQAWEDNGLDVSASFSNALLPLLDHKHAFVRRSAGKGIATAAETHRETLGDLITHLIAFYGAKNMSLEPQYDRNGLVIEETLNRKDLWQARDAIASTFHSLAELIPAESLVQLFDFMIAKEGLGDRHEAVRRTMLGAAAAVIDHRGKEKIAELIAMFESALDSPRSGANDDVTEAIIILFGRLAKHLSPGDKRVSQVIRRLIEALKTPSELVQVAVADCLAPLTQSEAEGVPGLFESLFEQLLHSPKYAERRGAAYGLAGLVKGRGVSSIAEFDVMHRLAQALEDKKDAQARQGAMMAYETLIATLQRLFEPYVPQTLPHLLACFGDSSTEVREATQETSRVIMQNISGYGVRLIMPSLLEGLDEKQWRTKKGAIELLGAMAYCAPRQLSQFLPTIIPHLSEPIKDSHNQVRQSAERALKGFGDVINNPEVKQLVPIIMKALVDPNAKTFAAQKAILKQKWVHVLDGPSLALLIPVVDRGLRERGAQIQKDAARIVGNLASLTDSKDFVPYLEILVPLVRTILVSPVPDARASAAKSLGTLVERLGEVHFVNLVPSLLEVLKSDMSSVDRQGSAQGLAEVLAGLGVDRMEALLPDIINNAQMSKRATVRESHILLLIYLPATFGLRFSPYLGRIIPPILGGIADDSDSVREASMRAGRMIIANYSNRAVDLLLPELESGLFDENWRIRLSSIQLISDLLFRLSGITGNNEVENEGENGDEEKGADQNIMAGNSIQRALAEMLGIERRNKILAAFYILRQDSVVNVRQAAIHTWKALVTNTPKLAREVLPLLVDLITHLLAQGIESREMAGRALGELVSKLGERILGESIPMLQSKANDDDVSLRAGVCTAVTEILTNSTGYQLQDHQDNLISMVRDGLLDPALEVREAAAEAFDALQEHVGSHAIDEIVPGLLEALVKEDDGDGDDDDDESERESENEDLRDGMETKKEKPSPEEGDAASSVAASDVVSEDEEDDFVDNSEHGRALSALQEIMKGSAHSVFPVLVPTLIEQPMSAFNASALVTLASLAGSALYKRLATIMEAFGEAIDNEEDEELRESLQTSLSTLMSCIYEYDGVYQLMTVLLSWSASFESDVVRARGCRYFAEYCNVKADDADLGTYGIDWIRRLVSLFDDRNDEVVDAAVAGMDALIKTVPKEDLENVTVPLHHTLETTGSAGRVLAGFLRPKGAAPLGAVFLAGLMNGTAEQREMGAYGLADIVERSSAETIKPLVVSMIGPLIRTCGDRHMSQVKTAILYALTTMLNFPQHCKPFYPQLQRSFQKAVSDASSNKVRTQAGLGLGRLMRYQTRVDSVISELLGQIEPGNRGPASEVPFELNDLAISGARALARVLENAPAENVSQASRASIVLILENVVRNQGAHESFKIAIGDVLGSYFVLGDSEKDVARLVDNFIARSADGICDPAFASICVLDLLTKAPEKLYASLSHPRKIARLVGGWVSDGPAIARPARQSRDILQGRAPWNQDEGVHDVLG